MSDQGARFRLALLRTLREAVVSAWREEAEEAVAASDVDDDDDDLILTVEAVTVAAAPLAAAEGSEENAKVDLSILFSARSRKDSSLSTQEALDFAVRWWWWWCWCWQGRGAQE